MTTCIGTYRDEHVPPDVGVLATVSLAYCSHAPTERCLIEEGQPHYFSQCGEFDPIRPGFEPPPEQHFTKDRPPWIYDWDLVFARLDAGESIYTILAERSLLRYTTPSL